MREDDQRLPEIVDAYERETRFFAVVQVILGDRPHAFEFRVRPTGYRALRRILESRPYVLAGRGRSGYRYFFVPVVRRRRSNPARVEFSIQIEQGSDRCRFRFDAPRDLVSNLLWFCELERPEDASDLRRVDARTSAR